MRTVLFYLPLLILLACSAGDAYRKPADPEEAGGDFIRAALNGDYKKVRLFILKDRDNERLGEKWESQYRGMSNAEKESFRQASVVVHRINPASDSVVYINFENSYLKKPQELKLVKRGGEWWVDLKYTFTGKTENIDI